ncbi:hypothetical protein AC629_13900 [Bradyrhizobium sp. NAS80.1]|uniref:FAD binding domain-containing protein n=1 Tax=Bradyrhizobium sp. NAS80.1 TaxID=1680159 RepID=UPI000959BFD4|nr:FAD binding domain-containing protein [Bradyrhizobium sp. NAS80.1]OKO87490.1 hypothetical protein AC629_13900 [Bradyrhizobium sp. NAS80.1]
MKASAFAYARATSVANARELLAVHGEKARVLSGGQSLIPAINLQLVGPEAIVDIGELTELRRIAVKGETLVIGALTRHADLLKSSDIVKCAPRIELNELARIVYFRPDTLPTGMVDYLVPMFGKMPDTDVGHVVSPTRESELGTKGAGEAGTAGAAAAVTNAVNDALKPFGTIITEIPLTPQVILTALGQI